MGLLEGERGSREARQGAGSARQKGGGEAGRSLWVAPGELPLRWHWGHLFLSPSYPGGRTFGSGGFLCLLLPQQRWAAPGWADHRRSVNRNREFRALIRHSGTAAKRIWISEGSDGPRLFRTWPWAAQAVRGQSSVRAEAGAWHPGKPCTASAETTSCSSLLLAQTSSKAF